MKDYDEYIKFRSEYLQVEFNKQWKKAAKKLLIENGGIFQGGLSWIGKIIVEFAREPKAALPAAEGELLNFFVKTPTGMTITMLCDRLDPIEMMKGFIQQKTKTPVRALIFSGKKLEEGRTFEEYNISKENAHGICTVFAVGPVVNDSNQNNSQTSSAFFPSFTSPQKIIGQEVIKFVESMVTFLKTQKQVVWDQNAASSFVASALSGMIKGHQAFTEGLEDPYRYSPEIANHIRRYVAKNPSLPKIISENPDYAVILKNRLAKGEFMELKTDFSIAPSAISAKQLAQESKCSLM